MTPERRGIMCRAAALAVRNVVRAAVSIGAMKSSTAISASGVPWVYGWAIRLKEMSMPPALVARRLLAHSATDEFCRSSRSQTVSPQQDVSNDSRDHRWQRAGPAKRSGFMSELQTVMTGIVFGEQPRWHEDRLWFSDWGRPEVIAVDLDGNSEVILKA